MHLRKDVLTIGFISAMAFMPSLFVAPIIQDRMNSGLPNLLTSVFTLALSGAIALPIYFGLGLRLKIAPITFAADAIKSRLVKR
jgi:hypothetical protein